MAKHIVTQMAPFHCSIVCVISHTRVKQVSHFSILMMIWDESWSTGYDLEMMIIAHLVLHICFSFMMLFAPNIILSSSLVKITQKSLDFVGIVQYDMRFYPINMDDWARFLLFSRSLSIGPWHSYGCDRISITWYNSRATWTQCCHW